MCPTSSSISIFNSWASSTSGPSKNLAGGQDYELRSVIVEGGSSSQDGGREQDNVHNAPPSAIHSKVQFDDFDNCEEKFLKLYEKNFVCSQGQNLDTVNNLDFRDSRVQLKVRKQLNDFDFLRKVQRVIPDVFNLVHFLRNLPNLPNNLRNLPNDLRNLKNALLNLPNDPPYSDNLWDQVFIAFKLGNIHVLQLSSQRMEENEDIFREAGELLKKAREAISKLSLLNSSGEEIDKGTLSQLGDLQNQISAFSEKLSQNLDNHPLPDGSILDNLGKSYIPAITLIIHTLGHTGKINSTVALFINFAINVLFYGLIAERILSKKLAEREATVTKTLKESVFTGEWPKRLRSEIDESKLSAKLEKRILAHVNLNGKNVARATDEGQEAGPSRFGFWRLGNTAHDVHD